MPAGGDVSEGDETRWLKLQRVSRDLADRLARRAGATGLRARVVRLESRVDSEKTRIGRALYPLVERAEITVGLPEVQEGVEEIARLREEIRHARARIEELEREPGPPALPPGSVS
jgi:ubiquinone biosynthesis protein UbiJ